MRKYTSHLKALIGLAILSFLLSACVVRAPAEEPHHWWDHHDGYDHH